MKEFPGMHSHKVKKRTSFSLIVVEFALLLGLAIINYSHQHAPQKKEVLGVVAPKKIQALQIPNDPRFNEQWALSTVSATPAWDKTTGSDSVIIAILDTGIVSNHQDLASKLVPGYDFVGNDSDTNPDPGGGSAVYHGTVVAGEAAASTNNSLGIAGDCWNCKIMPVRVMNNDGSGTTDVIANGIMWATDHGAKIINMSFGYGHEYGPDSYLTPAIDYAYSHGVVMVAAAGNDGEGVNYPAAYDKVIAVGAIDNSDTRPVWSSHGPELDVTAPGVSVLSTYSYWNNNQYITNAYANVSGTSIATPIVSGVAALAITKFPSLSNVDIKNIIIANTDKPSGMSGNSFTSDYGYGRINANMILSSDFSVSYPQNNEVIYDVTPTFNGKSLPSKTIMIKVDSGADETTTADGNGDWHYDNSLLAMGSHTLTVQTTDGDNNPLQKVINFSLSGSTTIYRFWSKQKQHHFYTISSDEKNYVINNYSSDIWSFEGESLSGFPSIADNSVPVYRFWSNSKQGHFYTADASEKNNVINNMPEWKYEGIAFYVYPTQVANAKAVYRFWSDLKQGHFYTSSSSEKDYVINNMPEWKYEGIVFYVP